MIFLKLKKFTTRTNNINEFQCDKNYLQTDTQHMDIIINRAVDVKKCQETDCDVVCAKRPFFVEILPLVHRHTPNEPTQKTLLAKNQKIKNQIKRCKEFQF